MHEALSVEQRVALVERRQRYLLVAWLVLGVAVAADVGWRLLSVPKVLSAQRFVVRDSGGGMRGEWGPSDVTAGEIDGKTVYASTTCITVRSNGRSGLSACVPWESKLEPFLSIRHETGARVSMSAGPYDAVLVLRTPTPTSQAKLSTFVAGAWGEPGSGPGMRLTDGVGRTTLVGSDGLVVRDTKAVLFSTPGAATHAR